MRRFHPTSTPFGSAKSTQHKVPEENRFLKKTKLRRQRNEQCENEVFEQNSAGKFGAGENRDLLNDRILEATFLTLV